MSSFFSVFLSYFLEYFRSTLNSPLIFYQCHHLKKLPGALSEHRVFRLTWPLFPVIAGSFSVFLNLHHGFSLRILFLFFPFFVHFISSMARQLGAGKCLALGLCVDSVTQAPRRKLSPRTIPSHSTRLPTFPINEQTALEPAAPARAHA